MHSLIGTTFFIDLNSLSITALQITEIDIDGLRKLPKIAGLDLSNNNIHNVPPELGNVRTLK